MMVDRQCRRHSKRSGEAQAESEGGTKIGGMFV